MINIKRTSTIPKSLDKPEIKQYIQELAEYSDNPQNRQEPQKPHSYRNSDILELFDKDFFAKCYLTEEQFVNSWTMDIDHFIPQNERPDLTYEWTNLFPISHCAVVFTGTIPGVLYRLTTCPFVPDFLCKDKKDIVRR
jgi:hypothetical protein